MNMEGNKIAKSTLSVAVVLIFVKFVGIIKQSTIAAYFGAGSEMDRFLIASDFVTQTGTLFFSALSISFLTIYVDTKTNGGIKKANQFVSNTLWTFIPLAGCVSIIFFLFADVFAMFLAPGYSEADRTVVADYMRLICIVIVNACVTNICTGVLEGEKLFFPAKFCGLFQSACMIAACTLFSDRYGIRVLLIAFIIYYVIENLYLLILVRRLTGVQLTRRIKDSRMLRLLKLSVPLFISNAIVELNNIGDKAIASTLNAGNISALAYGNYLFNSTHAIIIGSVCSVFFSYFSTYIAEDDSGKVRELLVFGIKRIIIVLLPVVIVFLVCGRDIIAIIYGRGKFDKEALSMTRAALYGYAPGILFIGIRDMFVRAHYAFQDSKQPMLNGLLGIIINLGLSVVLAMFFGLGVFGISFGSTVSYGAIAVVSYFTLKKHLKNIPLFVDRRFYLKLIVGTLCCLTVGMSIGILTEELNLFVAFFIKAVSVCIVYFAILFALKCEECLSVWRYIKGRLRH